MAEASESRPIRVLVVCTANICRSPMAAGFLRSAGPHLEVRSAGFLRAGEPAARHAIEVMQEHGINISDHVSRVVAAEDLEWADLIVTMERQHARQILLSCPGKQNRTFTLKSLASLLRTTPFHRGTSITHYLEAIASHRDASMLLGAGQDEISDPYGRRYRAYRRVAHELSTVTQEISDYLALCRGDA